MVELTLSVDTEVIERAKRLVAENQTSVSAMFSRFTHLLASDNGMSQLMGKLARRASGVIDIKGRHDQRTLAGSLADNYRF